MSRNNIIFAPTVDNYNSTLNGAISNTATTINLNSVVGLQNAAGILVIDRVDTSGNLTPTKQEWIYFSGVAGNAVTLPSVVDGRGVGGSTAQSHSDGAIVEAVMDVSAWGGLITSYVSQHADAGTHTAITTNTIGVSSNASIAGQVFSNNLSVGSLATISGKLIATNISMLSVASIADNTITANSLATGAITLGYAEITSPFTTAANNVATDVTGLAVTVTVPSGGRKIKVTVYTSNIYVTSGGAGLGYMLSIYEGATQLNRAYTDGEAAAKSMHLSAVYVGTPTAGSHTYKATVQKADTNTLTLEAGATYPAFILVELI